MQRRIRIRILVVDDDDAICRKLRGWLEAASYDVTVFGNGGDALQFAARVEHHLALVDWRLGDVDGIAVIEALTRTCPSMRVLALMAFPQAAHVIAAIRAGACDLVEKPFQRQGLLAMLDDHLARSGVAIRDESDFNARLGRQLRSIRQQTERTLEQVAETVGISPAQLSQIELGKTATSTWTLARVCAALRVPLGRLFENVERRDT